MSRHRSSTSYGQSIRRIAPDHFRLSWVVDYHYASSRQRHPRTFDRDTDLAGAIRFAAKWKLADARTTALLEQGS